MINSLCGSMGTVKTENSCSKPRPSSPAASISESSNTAASKFDRNSYQNPISTSLQDLKFEVDVEVQSPDWESLFADQLDMGTAEFMINSPSRDFMAFSPRRDFMISSPRRDFMVSSPRRDFPNSSPKRDYMVSSPKRDFMISSPKREFMVSSASSPKREFMVSSPKRTLLPHSSYNNGYSYVQCMHGPRCNQSLLGCCMPNMFNSAQMGAFNPNHKGKPQSPLHKVCNSTQFVQTENFPLPAMEGCMDDYFRGDFGVYPNPTMKMPAAAHCGPERLEMSVMALPGMLDCLPPMNSKFCGSISEASSSSQERDIYQTSSYAAPLPLSQQQQPQENLEQEQDGGLQLVHLLLACAEAVAKDDYMAARRFLHRLKSVVSPFGDSMQRVASCFTDALAARLTVILTTTPNVSNRRNFSTFLQNNNIEILKIYQILYQACPYVKFAHFTANQAIFEAFEAEDRVHVIDLDIIQGYQWPSFMQALAARPGGAPFLRITGVGTPLEMVRETGRRLTELAHTLHVPFAFHPIGEHLGDLQPHMFHRRVGEALAVNCVNRLHRVWGNQLGNLVGMIRDQAPNIFTLVEQEASHNGPYFLGRFLEALHYYSALFDSLDATFPADSQERAKVEQHLFAQEIMNIVACEGVERMERHERLEKWRKIMEGKGFKGVALSANAVAQSKILLGLYPCDGYRLTEDRGCLILGWQDRAVIAASAWRC